MALRESNTDKLSQRVHPSLGDKVLDNLDSAASHLPGQSKPRDALDSDARNPHVSDMGRPSAGEQIKQGFKPSGEQGVGEKLEQKYDQGASHVQPNKSASQKVLDAVTPGHTATDTGDRHVHSHEHTGTAGVHTGVTTGTHAGTGAHAHVPGEERTRGEKIGDKLVEAKDAIKNAL